MKDGNVQVVPGAVLIEANDFPLVYQPVPHLFDDVITGATTYVRSTLPRLSSEICQLIRDATRILNQYDQELYNGFKDAIGTLAVTGEWSPGNRSSYSTGALYAGGIFASISPESPALLVESLIHEYYHQRLWLWWLIEPPADIPDRSQTIISPVSGQERSIPIMMHALLIYVSLADYYHWASAVFDDDSGWIRAREKVLRSGSNQLWNVLRDALRTRPESLRFVNTVVECATPTLRERDPSEPKCA